MVSGLSPNGKERVHYLVEVCDPCEDGKCAYYINGVLVSDFYTPDYFDPRQARANGTVSKVPSQNCGKYLRTVT